MTPMTQRAPRRNTAGLVTPALIALESFWGIFFLRRSVRFPELLGVLASAFFTYSFW